MLTGVQLTSINNAQGSALALSILGIAVPVLAGITAGWFLVRELTPVFVTTKDAATAASDPRSRASMFFEEQKVHFDSDLTAYNLLSKNQDAASAALRPGATPDQMQKADDYARLLGNLARIRRIEDSQARVQNAKIAIAVCAVLAAGGSWCTQVLTNRSPTPSATVAPRPTSVNVLFEREWTDGTRATPGPSRLGRAGQHGTPEPQGASPGTTAPSTMPTAPT